MKKSTIKSIVLISMIAALCVITAVLAGCTGTNNGLKPTAEPTKAPEGDPVTYNIPDKYELNAWTDKVWEGNIVYWEPVTFVTDINGNLPELTLMYKPDQILEVRMADGFEPVIEGRDYQYDWDTNTFSLGNTMVLQEGRDYTVSNTGKITLKHYKQLVKITTYDELHPYYAEGQAHDWLEMRSDKARYFNLYNTIYKSRIFVTYTHSDTWNDTDAADANFVPQNESSHLPRTMEMLANKQDLNFVIYGDSIATGADGTGYKEAVIDVGTCKEVNVGSNNAPYTPSWAEMTTQKLKQVYGYEGINKINRAAGASESTWGDKNVEALVCPQNPDVVVIAFGMNENGRGKEEHKQLINSMINKIHALNPNCEFILMSSMEINPEVGTTTLSQFEDAYYEIQAERKDLHIAVCPVNSVFWAVTNRGKLFTDISSTNFNHPNDFLIRLYAQTLIATLGM